MTTAEDDTNPPDGSTSFRFGSAILRPTEEEGHYGLFRPLVIVRNDGGKITREQLEEPVGPLAVYRRRTKGDKMPEQVGSLPVVIRTSDPQTGQPFELILVWRPDTGDSL